MKNYKLWALALALTLVGCKGGNGTKEGGEEIGDSLVALTSVETQYACFADSSVYASVELKGDFPVGDDAVSQCIRDTLLMLLDARWSNPNYEEQRAFAFFTGESDEWREIVKCYGERIFRYFDKLSRGDEEERLALVDSTDEAVLQAEEMNAYIPQWIYTSEVTKRYETERYVVFSCVDYMYMGGAHGGTGGLGDITFDLHTGRRLTDFFRAGAERQMQALLQQGLVSYFSEEMDAITVDELWDYLQVDGEFVPLPAAAPTPTEEGLVLTYGQYEIACYAAGMPSFCLPYECVEPYLTNEAKEVLGLE